MAPDLVSFLKDCLVLMLVHKEAVVRCLVPKDRAVGRLMTLLGERSCGQAMQSSCGLCPVNPLLGTFTLFSHLPPSSSRGGRQSPNDSPGLCKVPLFMVNVVTCPCIFYVGKSVTFCPSGIQIRIGRKSTPCPEESQQ